MPFASKNKNKKKEADAQKPKRKNRRKAEEAVAAKASTLESEAEAAMAEVLETSASEVEKAEAEVLEASAPEAEKAEAEELKASALEGEKAAEEVLEASEPEAEKAEAEVLEASAPEAEKAAAETPEASAPEAEKATADASEASKAESKAKASPKKKKVPKTAAQKREEKLLGSQVMAYAVAKETAIGNYFYSLGFYTEYFVLLIARFLKNAAMFVAQVFVLLFGGMFKRFSTLVKGVARDIVAPFVRFRNQKTATQEEPSRTSREKGAPKAKTGVGIKSYLVLLGNIVKFIMPVVATAALVITVSTIFSRNYALAVEVNGEVIGYVADETVLEEAQNILRMKIQIAPNQSLAEWQFNPVLTIGTATNLSNKNEIADQILYYSSDNIMRATGIYIDGILVGVTEDEEALLQFLEDMKQKHYDPAHPDATISFVRTVEISPSGSLFFTDSVKPFAQLKNLLGGEVSPPVIHMVRKGETLEEIAKTRGITLEELVMRNPQYEGKKDNFKPQEGEEILIRKAQPYLQVQVAYRTTEREEIPYDVVETEDDSLAVGTTHVQVKGENGEQLVTYDIIYIDGEQAQKVRLEDQTHVLSEPVTQVVAKGTKIIELDPDAMPGGGAFGGYMWPVPDATYSSRGFMGAAHRGLDINAPTGTAIYASNAGVVVFSGWQWSFGYHVIIEHPDGRQTLYAHCIELYVAQGQYVGQGQLIAAVGSTGNSTGPHCHFEIIENGARVNPYGFVVAPW